jgi:hypothetical protein
MVMHLICTQDNGVRFLEEAQFGVVPKMFMYKKIKLIMKNVYLTLALVATLGLVSCGGGQSQEAATEVEATEVEAVEIDSATISDTTDPEGLEVEAVEEPAVE